MRRWLTGAVILIWRACETLQNFNHLIRKSATNGRRSGSESSLTSISLGTLEQVTRTSSATVINPVAFAR